MKSWEQVRNLGLIATLASSVLVLGNALSKPYAALPPQPSYSFAQTVPLAGWQLVQSIPTAAHKSVGPGFVTSVDDLAIAGQHYHYLRNGKPLDIEMRYFVNSYVDVADVLEDFTIANRNQKFTVVQASIGSYTLYQRSGKLHLAACITPSAQTTVTEGEFRGSQNRPAVLATRIVPWFLGFEPLRDIRCLWSQLSIPAAGPDSITVSPDSQEARELAQAWGEWAQWWKKNYPPKPSV